MRLIDEQYIRTPFFGSRRIRAVLVRMGHCINRKRVQRLMRLMGLEAIYPKPNLRLLRNTSINLLEMATGDPVERSRFTEPMG
jgi:hypothetical protein